MKSTSHRHGSGPTIFCALLTLLPWLAAAPDVRSAPAGERVVRGHATFQRDGALTTIQVGRNTVINFDSFNIRAGETVRFIQPNASARVLNRVLGTDPTTIFGTLLANGNVYIVNPSGVFFGRGSFISVGGLVAAAGSISDHDFLRHMNRFTGMQGTTENAGAIEARNVTLAGRNVANSGTIQTSGGLVALTAGSDVLLGQEGGHVFVNLGAASSPTDSPGVQNTGTIQAGRGRSILAAGDLYSLAVVNSGTIRAKEITLEGRGGGIVQVSGTLDASDRAPGGHGGSISVLGEKVSVTDAHLDASGDAGGGTVLVGGDYHGEGPVRTADHTFVDPDTRIEADAVSRGDGGKVIVWSDQFTGFYGSISARGGEQGGNGGFAEISSGQSLVSYARVSLSAPHGRTGTLLYDPLDIQILGSEGDGHDDGDFRADLLLHENNLPGRIGFGDESLSADGQAFQIYESEIEGTRANIILQARRSITTTGSFMDSDVRLRDNYSLTLQTRNNVNDGTGGINLTGSSQGRDLVFATGGSGSIHIAAGTDGGSRAGVVVGSLNAGAAVSLTARNGNIELQGNVTSRGSQNYDGPVAVNPGVTLSSSRGNIHFDDTVRAAVPSPILVPAGGVVVGAGLTINAPAGNITFGGTVGNDDDSSLKLPSLTASAREISVGDVYTIGDQRFTASDRLLVSSTYDSDVGDIYFNDAPGRANVRTASIVRDSPGDININARRFVMGLNEKMVAANGSINITAENQATLGDLGARDNISVQSPSILLRDRQPTSGDQGLDFVGRDILFTTDGTSPATPQLAGTGNGMATFANSGMLKVGNGAGIERFPLDSPQAIQSDSGRVLDPAVLSPVLSPGDLLPPLFPPPGETPEIALGDLMSAGGEVKEGEVTLEDLTELAIVDELVKLGIYARVATEEELARSLRGQGLYEQRLTTERPRPEDFKVVERRLSRAAVLNTLGLGRKLLQPEGPEKDRSEAIKKAVNEAFDGYVDKMNRNDIDGFLKYLGAAEAAGDARAVEVVGYLGQFRKLLARIGTLGLTSTELQGAESKILARIAIPNVGSSDMHKLVEGSKSVGPQQPPTR